jgi:hypothetical protein
VRKPVRFQDKYIEPLSKLQFCRPQGEKLQEFLQNQPGFARSSIILLFRHRAIERKMILTSEVDVKIIKIFLLVFLMATMNGFSQETGSALDEAGSNGHLLPDNRLLLHTDSLFSKTWYKSEDGTPVQYREVLALIAVVPENDSMIRQEKILRNLTYTTTGLFLASLAGTVVYSAGNFDEPWIFTSCFYTGMFSFLFTITFGDAANIKLQSAVDRYNLSVGFGR